MDYITVEQVGSAVDIHADFLTFIMQFYEI